MAADLDTPIETDFGLIPVGSFITFPMAGLVIDKWQLAIATGQNSDIDSSLAEICSRVPIPEADRARGGPGTDKWRVRTGAAGPTHCHHPGAPARHVRPSAG